MFMHMATLDCTKSGWESLTFTFPPEISPIRSKILHFLSLHPGNYIASHDERPIIESHLCQARIELAAYEGERQRVLSLLEELQARRNSLFQSATQLSGMVKPAVRRLPVELLMSVFRIYFETSMQDPGQKTHPALILGQVCSKWRAVTHTCPALWSRIHSDIYPCALDSEEALRFTRFCMKRSGRAPLQVSFNDTACKFKPVYHEVLTQSHRWKEVIIDRLPFSSGTFPNDLPALKTLALAISQSGRSMTFPDIISTPSLRELKLTYENLGLGLRVDTRSLLYLNVDGPYVDCACLFEILKRSPSLTSLQLNGLSLTNWPTELREPDPISLTSLHMDLSLRGHHAETDLRTIFTNTTTPSLKNLFIGSRYGPVEVDIQTSQIFHRFLTTPGPPLLTFLTLHNIYFENLRELFDSLTSLSKTLSRLSLVKCNTRDELWDEFLQLMTFSSDFMDNSFLSNLYELELDYYHLWTKATESHLLEMVESRWRVQIPAVTRLKQLQILCQSGYDRCRIVGPLEKFTKEGLRLGVCYHS